MRKTISRLFALFVILISSATIAFAQNRLALVVGNDNYSHVTRLQKAVNDATSMAQTLETLGFEVHQAYNTSRRDMNYAVEQFVNQIGQGDIAMVFFAGHGVEIKGENFLLPIDIPDAKTGQEGFVKGESISLNDILSRLKEKRAQLNIVILDACRNNPFSGAAGRSIGGTRGLARIAAPKGTFVMYSADTGEAALDRLSDGDKNENSVFTRLLIPRLKQPGLDLVGMARQVRRDVQKLALTVSHQQTPAYYDAVLGDFFIAGRKASALPPSSSKTTNEQSVRADEQEKTLWARVAKSTNPTAIADYLERFPNGSFKELAAARLNALKRQKVSAIDRSKTPAAKVVAAHKCDHLAASVYDPDRVAEGVDASAIDSKTAIVACEQAVATYPNVRRLEYQLARALDTNKNYKEAMKWYLRASEREHRVAMYNIAYLHQFARGVPRSYKKAAIWFRKSADLGDSGAMNRLGLLYHNGLGVARNYKTAVLWYQKAVNHGDPDALHNLALMYLRGHGVARNDDRAAELVFQALKRKNASSINQMTTNARAWRRTFRRALQRRLRGAGVYDGKIDGSFGPATKSAIIKLIGKS